MRIESYVSARYAIPDQIVRIRILTPIPLSAAEYRAVLKDSHELDGLRGGAVRKAAGISGSTIKGVRSMFTNLAACVILWIATK